MSFLTRQYVSNVKSIKVCLSKFICVFLVLRYSITLVDKADNSGFAIHHAMSNSVNPRTHSNHGTPVYTNPYINNTIAHTPDDSDEVFTYSIL
jgi:hypothetical protein